MSNVEKSTLRIEELVSFSLFTSYMILDKFVLGERGGPTILQQASCLQKGAIQKKRVIKWNYAMLGHVLPKLGYGVKHM